MNKRLFRKQVLNNKERRKELYKYLINMKNILKFQNLV